MKEGFDYLTHSSGWASPYVIKGAMGFEVSYLEFSITLR